MSHDAVDGQFGCEKCFGASAESFWEGWPRNFQEIVRLLDDPHDIVRIVACSACGQRYVAVTTEFVDWVDGDDPIYRSILPVTAEESAQLEKQGEAVDYGLIESFGKERRHLKTSYPKGEPQSVFWARGGLRLQRGG